MAYLVVYSRLPLNLASTVSLFGVTSVIKALFNPFSRSKCFLTRLKVFKRGKKFQCPLY